MIHLAINFLLILASVMNYQLYPDFWGKVFPTIKPRIT